MLNGTSKDLMDLWKACDLLENQIGIVMRNPEVCRFVNKELFERDCVGALQSLKNLSIEIMAVSDSVARTTFAS